MARTAAALGVLGAVLLSGCDRLDPSFQSASINASPVEGKIQAGRGERVRVWRDPDTGCQYLLYGRRRTGSMTPRLSADGRPMCRS